jgi:3-hydroxyisobutyrate dehydrogenase
MLHTQTIDAAPRKLPAITLVGLGEVGQIFATALLGLGVPVRVYHPAPGEHTRQAAQQKGLFIDQDAATAFGHADLVMSVAPGAMALDIAKVARDVMKPGALFADFTSAAPAVIRESANLFPPDAYVDVAIMGALSLHGHRTPLLAAGGAGARLATLLRPFGFEIECMPGSANGDATALKMLRSVFTKGMDAVVMECLLAAEAAGLRPQLMQQMADMDRIPMRETIEMYVRTHAASAARRLHEMEAVEKQLEALGIHTLVTPAVVARYRRTVDLLGPAARNPPLPVGGSVYDAVLPWLLAAERADMHPPMGDESSSTIPPRQGAA